MHWEFSFTPTEEEQLQALKWAQQRRPWVDRGIRLVPVVVAAIAGLALLDGVGYAAVPAIRFTLYGLLAALALQGVGAALLDRLGRRAALAADPALYLGPRRLWFDRSGLSLTWTVGELRFDWSAVSALEVYGGLCVLRAGAYRVLVPWRVFQDEDERRAWVGFVQARLTPTSQVVRHHGLEVGGRIWTAWVAPLLANFRAGARLALLQKVPAGAFEGAPAALLMLIAAWLALHGAADFADVGPAGQLSAEGIPGLFFALALMVAAAVLAAALGARTDCLVPSLAALWSAALPIAAVALLLPQLVRQSLDVPAAISDHLAYVFPSWLTLVAVVALSRFQRLEQRQSLVLAALLTGMVAAPLVLVPYDDRLWVPPPAPSEYDAKYEALTGEDAFYQQPRLLQRALDDLQPQRSGTTDLYFVGVGGDAEQSVFLKEVRSVAALMAQRFGAAGRSITLVNSYRAAMDYPVASVTALQQSIRRIGELMDRDQDILFLFLTSHGSRQHEFVLDFWPLRFKPLTPPVLRQMLDEARIRWRVIVVSACYSGGYIEPLKDDHTVVITAAAADRTSFGCSDENDWTYFGRALFQEALRDDGDLEQAFGLARRTIARREEEEEVEAPSDPQMVGGPAMLEKWRSFLAERNKPVAEIEQSEPGYRRLLDATDPASELPVFRSECRRQLDGLAPVRLLAKQPGYFGGLTPKSERWSALVGAWENYAERYCHLADESEFIGLYAQAWRDSISAEALGQFDGWLADPASQRFLNAQRQAERRFRRQLDDLRQSEVEAAWDEYHSMVRELVDAFRQSRSDSPGDDEEAPAATDPRP